MMSTLTRKRRRTTKVADMTVDDLQAMIEETVDRALAEWIGDPDAGLELRPEVVERLRRQEKDYADGKRGRPFEEVVKELGLD